jgi:hypothetical protein
MTGYGNLFFFRKNINCSIEDSLKRFDAVFVEAKKTNTPVRGQVIFIFVHQNIYFINSEIRLVEFLMIQNIEPKEGIVSSQIIDHEWSFFSHNSLNE